MTDPNHLPPTLSPGRLARALAWLGSKLNYLFVPLRKEPVASNSNDEEKSREERSVAIWAFFRTVFWGVILGLIPYALSYKLAECDWGFAKHCSLFLRVMGGAVVIATTFVVLGAIIGFLFGIPLTKKGDEDRDYRVNSNLETISQWLTNMIIGISLVELKSSISIVKSYARFMGPFLGDSKNNGSEFGAAAVLISLFGFGMGFFLGYIFTRLFLSPAFKRADMLMEGIGNPAHGSQGALYAPELQSISSDTSSETSQ